MEAAGVCKTWWKATGAFRSWSALFQKFLVCSLYIHAFACSMFLKRVGQGVTMEASSVKVLEVTWCGLQLAVCAVLGFVGIFVSVRYVSACPATKKTSRGGKLFGRFRVQTCDVAQTKHGSCRQQLELGPVVFGLQLVPKHVWNLGITCWCCPKSEQVILK